MTAEHVPSAEDGEDCDAPRVFRPQRALPTDVVRPTRAEVNLANLLHNLRVVRRAAGETPVWGVLKADAYGHGAKAVARTLERAGLDGVCVALVEEGVELREAGITCPILIMGGYYGSAYRELIHFRLTPVLVDAGQVEALARAASGADERLSVHLKVDTGMGRLGVRQQEWATFARVAAERPMLEATGLMTHFASADHEFLEALDVPLARFRQATELFRAQGLAVPCLHAANSAALFRQKGSHFSLVRPGVALFGVEPLPAGCPRTTEPREIGQLRPVMSVTSRVVALRELEAGATVGYGATFIARRRTRIATVPLGYADGLSRALSNRGALLVRGRRAPIAGVVSMDMTTIDVTDVPDCAMGDEVVLLGAQRFGDHSASINVAELAAWTGSIPWEVLTSISRRVPRFYRQA